MAIEPKSPHLLLLPLAVSFQVREIEQESAAGQETEQQKYVKQNTAAKEAQALAEERTNNEARTELESRLNEAGERESMLVQALEESRQTLSKKEQQTILVVAVGTCGVVQLGSLRKVEEDVTLMNHIRHLFSGVKDPLAEDATNLLQCNMNDSLCLVKIFFIQL